MVENQILDEILFFLGLVYLFYSLFFLFQFFKKYEMWRVFTFLYMFFYAFILTYYHLYSTHTLQHYPYLFGLNINAIFIIVPSIFLATRRYIYHAYRYSFKDMVHILPFIFVSIEMFPVWSLSSIKKINWILHDEYRIMPFSNYGNGIVLACFLEIALYFIFQIFEISKRFIVDQSGLNKYSDKNTLIQLLVIRSLNFTWISLIFLEIWFSLPEWLIKCTSILLVINSLMLSTFQFVYSYLFKIRHHQIKVFRYLYRPQSKLRYSNSHWIKLEKNLQNAISEKKIFKNEKLNVYHLSENLDVSPRMLSQYFNQILSMSFSEYVAGVRIEEAKELFQTTEKSIAEITYECGFNSSSKFYEHFRKKTGYTPAQYKSMVHKNKEFKELRTNPAKLNPAE